MKPWRWALGASLALHGALFATVAHPPPPRSPSPPAGERVGERGDQIVDFTSVTLAGVPPQQPPTAVLPERSRGARVTARPAIPEGPSTPLGGLIARTNCPSPVSPSEVEGRLPSANSDSSSRPSTPLGQNGGSLRISANPLGENGGDEEAEGSPTPGIAEAEAPVVVEPGPDVIALVHARLAAMADRCYPAAARRFQQRGTVQLSFCTDANGGAASAAITRSSGAELLDAAARGCVVEKAAPFPPEAASRCFSVPVRFGARQ